MTNAELERWARELQAQREHKARYKGHPSTPHSIHPERKRLPKRTEKPVAQSYWLPATDGDDRARALYLRHYSSKKNRTPGKTARQFLKPGEKMLLLTVECSAVFAWVRQQYRRDGQEGVECTIFRNEGETLSSVLIREADQLADERWPNVRHFTYVDPSEVESSNPGYCFLQAGWRRVPGETSRGLIVLERTQQAALPCVHRFRIEEPCGKEILEGVCKHCGETKQFSAWLPNDMTAVLGKRE